MLPSGAVDCHAHVFGGAEYPFDAAPPYLPLANQKGTAADFLAVLDAHRLTHGLLVAAAPYGPDNSCMLDAIAASPGRLKGIALARPTITDRALAALAEGGVVGLRMNLAIHGPRQLIEPGADRLLARVREMGWFLQIHCEKDNLVDALPIIERSGVRVMIDHFARPDLERGLAQPGFAALLRLGRSGNAVVKLSGAYLVSREGPPYRDVDPYLAAAAEAFTLDNVVWGSDWPFVLFDRRVDYGPQLTCIERCFPDPKDRQRLMWDNPARLFGFARHGPERPATASATDR